VVAAKLSPPWPNTSEQTAILRLSRRGPGPSRLPLPEIDAAGALSQFQRVLHVRAGAQTS
jgi:hypothetical protein